MQRVVLSSGHNAAWESTTLEQCQEEPSVQPVAPRCLQELRHLAGRQPGWQGGQAAHAYCFCIPSSPCQLKGKMGSHPAFVVYNAGLELCWSHSASPVS